MAGSLVEHRVPLTLEFHGNSSIWTAPRLCIGEVEICGVADQATELAVYYGEDLVQAQRRNPYTGWVDLGCDAVKVAPGSFVVQTPIRRSMRVATVDPNPAVRIESIAVKEAHFEGPHPGHFVCSDKQVNDLWELAAHTVRCCSQDFLEDGTGRDGICWVGDCSVSGQAALLVIDGADLLKYSLNMFLSLARPDGSVPSNALHAGGHQLDRQPYLRMNPKSPLGEWIVANYVADYIVAVRDYLQWTDDADFRGRFNESVCKAGLWCMKTLRRLAAGEDTGFYLSDNDGSTEGKWWKSPGMFAAQLYRGVAAAAELTGDVDLAKNLSEMRAIVDAYRVGDGLFSDSLEGRPSRHATAAAVLAGLVPASPELFDDRHYVSAHPLVCGYAASQWLAAIARAGDTALMLDHFQRWWGPMVDAGSTTAWERVDPKDGSYPRADGAPVSQCHAWSGAPAALLPFAILGVECRAPGWRTVSISPRLGPLNWAEVSISTPRGLIKIRAERGSDGAVVVEKSLPDECIEVAE